MKVERIKFLFRLADRFKEQRIRNPALEAIFLRKFAPEVEFHGTNCYYLMKANLSSCLPYRHKKDERNQGYSWRHCLSERDF